jgi:hypothetical protein
MLTNYPSYGISPSLPSVNGWSCYDDSRRDRAEAVYRYASDLTPDQKDALLDVIRATPHAQIGPEIRRELVNAVARGEPRPDDDEDVAMG